MPAEVGTQNWLIVGLGNPGLQYAKTRHNLGFMLVDLLATQLQTQVRRDECRSLIGRAVIDNQTVELAKPQTFMNLSGEAVSGLLAKDDRSVKKLIIISDDIFTIDPVKIRDAKVLTTVVDGKVVYEKGL